MSEKAEALRTDFLNELEGWVRDWFEKEQPDLTKEDEAEAVIDAATILMVIDGLRDRKEAK